MSNFPSHTPPQNLIESLVDTGSKTVITMKKLIETAAPALASHPLSPLPPQGSKTQIDLSQPPSTIDGSVFICLSSKKYGIRQEAAVECRKAVKIQLDSKINPPALILHRIHHIVSFLSAEFVSSENENARKGGVMALASITIELIPKGRKIDIALVNIPTQIFSSIVHSTQDNIHRVRYYSCEALYNTVKHLPHLVVENLFVMFETLKLLASDVDSDVQSGAEFLEKKVRGIVVDTLKAEPTTPPPRIMKQLKSSIRSNNHQTKRLALVWLESMAAHFPSPAIHVHIQLQPLFNILTIPSMKDQAMSFLDTMLILLCSSPAADQDQTTTNKIFAELSECVESPDPTIRQTSLEWILALLDKHVNNNFPNAYDVVPILLPAVLTTIGNSETVVQINNRLICLVANNPQYFVVHLETMLLTLVEELTFSPSKASLRALERAEVVDGDGLGIEKAAWFTEISSSTNPRSRVLDTEACIAPLLCAMAWIELLFTTVCQPESSDADFFTQTITPPLVSLFTTFPPQIIIETTLSTLVSCSGFEATIQAFVDVAESNPKMLQRLISTSDLVFTAFSGVPPRQVLILFSKELRVRIESVFDISGSGVGSGFEVDEKYEIARKTLGFYSAFVSCLHNVLLSSPQTKQLRSLLTDRQNSKDSCTFFDEVISCWAHDLSSALSLCLFAGRYEAANIIIMSIHPLDITLSLLLSLDRLVALFESPPFFHLRMDLLVDGHLLKALKNLLMVLPIGSSAYRMLKERVCSANSVSREAKEVEEVEVVEAAAAAAATASVVNSAREKHLEIIKLWSGSS